MTERQRQRMANDLRLAEMTSEQLRCYCGPVRGDAGMRQTLLQAAAAMESLAQQIENMLSAEERRALNEKTETEMTDQEKQALGEKVASMTDTDVEDVKDKVVKEGYHYYYPYYWWYRRYYNPFMRHWPRSIYSPRYFW